MDRLKILHILGDKKLPQSLEVGATSGIVRIALDIASCQAALGHDVTVIAVGSRFFRVKWKGVYLICLPQPLLDQKSFQGLLSNFTTHYLFVSFCLLGGYDIVHAHSYTYLRFIRAKKKILHFHSDPLYDPVNTQKDHLSKQEHYVLTTYNDAIIGVTELVSQVLKDELGDLKRIYAIPNGIEAKAIINHADANKRPYLRNILHIAPDDVVVLYAGAITEVKGVMYLAKAFEQLCGFTKNVHLLLAGSSTLWKATISELDASQSYEANVRRILMKQTKLKKVHFMGLINANEMHNVYESSDIIVVPSVWREALGMVALEAALHHLPIIASRTGGLVEIVEDGKNGILVNPGDSDEILEALKFLCSNPNVRREMGQKSFEKVKNYSLRETVAKIEAVYRVVLGKEQTVC